MSKVLVRAVPVHAVLLFPLVGAFALFLPSRFGYLVYGFIGWSAINMIKTIQILRSYRLQALADWMRSFTRVEIGLLILLMTIYLNFVIGIAAGVGSYLSVQVGLPFVGFVVTLLYAGTDAELAKRWTSPGLLLLTLLFALLHVFGELRHVSASQFIDHFYSAHEPT